jgi:hypothetical protein
MAQLRKSRNAWIESDAAHHFRRRRLHSYCHRRQCILPFNRKPESGARRAQETRRASAVSSPPKKKRSSERHFVGRCASFHRLPGENARQHAALPALTYCPSVLSSSPCARHHPNTRTKLPLPCSRFAKPPLAATQTTLPHYGLSITVPTSTAPRDQARQPQWFLR